MIKHVLEECDEEYDDKAELPKLYRAAAKALNLAPDHHLENPRAAPIDEVASV